MAFRAVRSRYPFNVDAVVVLPDYLHCIWSLPKGDADFAKRWRLIKTWFTKRHDSVSGNATLGGSGKQQQGRLPVWQNRYWEHALRDEADMARHIDYIHFNPVKHGLVPTVREWPYSSFHRYVKAGLYPPDWGQGVVNPTGVGHE
jgi:putative transposase